MKVIVDDRINNLDHCGVYSEDKLKYVNINDYGELMVPIYSHKPPEVKGGRSLKDHNIVLHRKKLLEVLINQLLVLNLF